MRAVLSLLMVGLLSSACAPFAFGNGELGGYRFMPWSIRTQYAYVDKKERKDEGGREVYASRSDDAGGDILKIALFGFTFNAFEDRRTWNSLEWQHYINGLETQPNVYITVARVNKMSSGDDVKLDTTSTAPISVTDPVLAVTYNPGKPRITNGSTYPDKRTVYGSRVKATLTLSAIADEPGPTGWVRGSLEYSVERQNGDPDDALEGEFTLNFSAQVVGERLAECNEGTTPFGQAEACTDEE